MEVETHYAKSGDVHIAYQVVGQGPDLVLVPGWVSHIEYAWEVPSYSHFLHRLASFSRLILMDRRGTGLSDPVVNLPTLEERMDDVRAVMDAVGSERASLFGISEGGPMCSLFAATYPQRTSALVLYGTLARGSRTDDYPWAPTKVQFDRLLERMEAEWGSGFTARLFAPSHVGNAQTLRDWAQFERRAVSPGGARKLMSILLDTDVREILPAIRVPTLVMHRSGDRATRVEGGRYIAANIPGARYLEFPGDDHFPWIGDAASLLGEVEEFLTGVRGHAESERVLATVLFTDIVDSTARASELGDSAWRELLERHHDAVRRELHRFQGSEVDTAGDGFFATFDGPARAIRCACAIRDSTAGMGISIRAGLHTGECEMMAGKVGGIAVNIGARVAGSADSGEVLVSSTVVDLVAGSGLAFDDRGGRELKGVPGQWRLFAVAS